MRVGAFLTGLLGFGLVLVCLIVVASVMVGAISVGNLLLLVPLLGYAAVFFMSCHLFRLIRKDEENDRIQRRGLGGDGI